MTKRLVPAGALALTLAFTGPVPALAGTALVGNENGGTISLIDTARDEVVGEIKTAASRAARRSSPRAGSRTCRTSRRTRCS